MSFELNLHDIPTPELWQRIQTVNEKSTSAPAHLRPRLYELFLKLSQEYSTRTDK